MLMLQNTEELPEGDAICACSSTRTYGRRYRRTAALASSGPFIVQMDWRWYRTGPVMAWHWVRKDHCLVCLEVESGVAQGSCSAQPCRSRTSKIANRRPRLPSAAQRSAKLPKSCNTDWKGGANLLFGWPSVTRFTCPYISAQYRPGALCFGTRTEKRFKTSYAHLISAAEIRSILTCSGQPDCDLTVQQRVRSAPRALVLPI
jgi:hypothetical protein